MATKESTGGGAAPTEKKTGERTAATRHKERGAEAARDAGTGAERWLFAAVGAGDAAVDWVKGTAERTRTLLTGGRTGAAESASVAVDLLAVRGRSVLGRLADSGPARRVTERTGTARRRVGAVSSKLGKAASTAVDAGKSMRGAR